MSEYLHPKKQERVCVRRCAYAWAYVWVNDSRGSFFSKGNELRKDMALSSDFNYKW